MTAEPQPPADLEYPPGVEPPAIVGLPKVFTRENAHEFMGKGDDLPSDEELEWFLKTYREERRRGLA